MKLRRARLADVDALLEVENEAFATDRLTAVKLRRLLTRGNCDLLVAEARGRVAGYALVLFRRGIRTARLYGLAVARDFRGRGLARTLLREAQRGARRRGAERMTLEVFPGNFAVNIYRKEGYRLLRHLGPYYADGTPADRYAKSLAAPPRPRPRAILRARHGGSPVKSGGVADRVRVDPGRGVNPGERRLREPRAVEREES